MAFVASRRSRIATPTRRQSTYECLKMFQEAAACLAEAESAGMRIDVAYLDRAIGEVGQQIEALEDQLKADKVYRVWQKRFKEKTKLGSREQLGKVLFEDLKYEAKETTATGRFKASKDVLDDIDLPFVKRFIEVEELKKLLATNLLGIKGELVGEFIHVFFHLHTTVTGRASSSSINFQNQPNRNPKLSEIVRRCFIPRDGNVLLEIDFKGIEVAIAAAVTQDPVLIAYVKDPSLDMHRDTAMQLFFLTKEQVDKKTTRDWSKNRFVFPQFYGSVYFQCAPHLWEVANDPKFKLPGTDISIRKHLKANGIKRLGDCSPGVDTEEGTFVHHVKQIEQDFWQRRFKVYTKKKREWWDDYCEHGGYMTATGLYIEGEHRRNQVTNGHVQGPAAHCAVRCMTKTHKWLKKNKMKTLLIGTIHDSVNFDADPDELPDVVGYFKECVANLHKTWDWIIVPLSVEVEVATPTWFHKKPWEGQ